MNDPGWYSRLPRWAQDVVDQAAHMALGGGVSALVGGLCTLALEGGLSGLIGAVAGTIAMVVYELVQNLGDASNRTWDSVIDTAFGTLGAVLVGLIIWGVA